MRFASLGGQSNYAQAGKAVADDAAKIFKAARDNSPNFGELSQRAMVEKSKVNRAAEENATALKINDNKIKQNDIVQGSRRKAGVVAAMGKAGMGMADMFMGKEKKADYSSYDAKIKAARDGATALRAEADAINTEFKPATTAAPAETSDSTVSSSASVSSPSSPPGSSAAPPSTGGSLNFQSVKAHAQQAGAKYPELVAAQWALESGWGKSPSGKNNYFGIKATSGEAATSHQTWEVRNGKDVTETARFKNFDTPQGSINEVVSKWHKNYGNYSGVNNASSAFDAANMLRTQGYATDPAYSKKLQQIMKDNS